jgi:beta-N-acetylhexosaminidase
MALLSGNDVLLFPDRISTAIRKLKKQLRRNPALQKQLDLSVRKILEAKYDAGLFRDVLRDEDNLVEQLNSPTARLLQEDAFAQAITVVRNDQQTLPIQQLDNRTFGSLSIGAPAQNTFTKYLSRYAPFNHQSWQIAKDSATIGETLTIPDVLVVGIFPMASSFQTAYKKLLDDLANKTTLIVVQFDAPSKLSIIDNQPTMITAYADHQSLQRMVPQVIFGARAADARLPLLINDSLKQGKGVTVEPIGRMQYTLPEAAGIDSRMLNKISNVVREAIDQKATPGCQVIVVRKGKVVFDRAFGWQTYDNRVPVNDETIYDLASITKVAATLQGVMFLYDHNLIDINRKASWYLPELRNTNKENLVIKDILTHQAGLWPFVPFWVQTIKDSVWMPEYYSQTRTDEFPYQVAPHLFTNQAMKDSVWAWSLRSKMREKAARTPFNYTYSDIGMYIMHRMNERLLNQSQEEFLQQNLYEPLGANTLGYLPLNRFDVSRIAPTEKDKIFRRELLVGTVHDEGAALLGGIAGHAGLFGNANDLAKLGQMLLQKGYYGGQQFFSPGTVELFTFRQYENSRRGLGWDKPVLSDWNTPTSAYASPKTYGHTGFTGTCIWVDPEFDLVYVFLSNRVYPSRDGNKLSGLNIRSRIQDIIYQSIFSYNQYQNLNVWKR